MLSLEVLKQDQRIREAEGYLELLSLFADKWETPKRMRDRLVRRALDILMDLDSADDGFHEAHVLYLIGWAMRTSQRYEDAVFYLRDASELEPDRLETWLELGFCHKRCGRLDLAIEALEEAFSINPDEGIVHYNLACYWSLAGNLKLALAYLSNSFDIDPQYRGLVEEEADFDPIRANPTFQELTA